MQCSGKSSVRITMEQVLSTLDHFAHGTEDDFLALGSRLQITHCEAATLHGRIQAGIRTMATVDESGLLKEVDEEAMQGINGLFTRIASVAGEAAQISRNITLDIGAVVMGIQFHDDFRQRLEHISQSLLDVLPHLEEAAAREDDRENPAPGAGESFMVVELQRSQLIALHHELGEVFQAQARSFTTIAEAIGQLTRTLGKITTNDADSSGGEDVFACLSQAVALLTNAQQETQAFEVQAILNAFQEFREKTAEIIADGELLGESVAGERRQLSFFHDMETKLAEQAAVLGEIAAQVRPSGEDLAKALAADVFNSIAARYTTEKEWTVHRQLLPTAGRETTPGLDTSDLDAGVVIFEKEEIPAGPKSPASGEAKEKKEFGENAELF